jgi:hypothetical protein
MSTFRDRQTTAIDTVLQALESRASYQTYATKKNCFIADCNKLKMYRFGTALRAMSFKISFLKIGLVCKTVFEEARWILAVGPVPRGVHEFNWKICT